MRLHLPQMVGYNDMILRLRYQQIIASEQAYEQDWLLSCNCPKALLTLQTLEVNSYLDFVQQTASEQETYQAAIYHTADRQIIVKPGAFFDVSQSLQEQSSMHLERSTMRITQVLDKEPIVIIRIP